LIRRRRCAACRAAAVVLCYRSSHAAHQINHERRSPPPAPRGLRSRTRCRISAAAWGARDARGPRAIPPRVRRPGGDQTHRASDCGHRNRPRQSDRADTRDHWAHLRLSARFRALRIGCAARRSVRVEAKATNAGAVRALACPTRSGAQAATEMTHHCDIVETGNDSWRFKSRDDVQTTRARAVSATPTSSDDPSATSRARRSKGSLLDADRGSQSNAD